MGKVGDEVLDELSDRCLRLLRNKVLIAHTIFGEPFRELYTGPVSMQHMIDTDHLTVHIQHTVYNHTRDLVYSVRETSHLFSRWPHVYDVLTILRIEMILDDLAAM